MSEPLAGEQSAIEIRSVGMPGEPDEVGHILVVDDDVMVRQTDHQLFGGTQCVGGFRVVPAGLEPPPQKGAS